jgi:hypothetical protein
LVKYLRLLNDPLSFRHRLVGYSSTQLNKLNKKKKTRQFFKISIPFIKVFWNVFLIFYLTFFMWHKDKNNFLSFCKCFVFLFFCINGFILKIENKRGKKKVLINEGSKFFKFLFGQFYRRLNKYESFGSVWVYDFKKCDLKK